MIIYGGNSNLPAEVNEENRLLVDAILESYGASGSRQSGRSFSIVAIDDGPVAAEFTLYLQNLDSERIFVIDKIVTSQVDADVIWKLHKVTGTGAGTDIEASNLNLNSSRTADLLLNALGGPAAVTGLTSAAVLHAWMGGPVYSSFEVDLNSALVLGQNDAIAVEYDAGTGGACSIAVIGHQYPW